MMVSQPTNVELYDTKVVNKTKHNFKTRIGDKYTAKGNK